MESLHENGIRPDCSLQNLSYRTAKRNWVDRKRHGRGVDGITNPNSKLTESEIEQIRSLNGKLSYTEIGRQFNISDVHAGTICRRN
jgi:hypothetical protein